MNNNEHNNNNDDVMDREAMLTAYALGELDNLQAQQFAMTIADDADAQAEVGAVQELSRMLGAEFAAEPAPELTDEQRDAVASAGPSVENEIVVETFPFRRYAFIGGGVALAAVMTLAFAPMFLPEQGPDAHTSALNLEESDTKTDGTWSIDADELAVAGEKSEARRGGEAGNLTFPMQNGPGRYDDTGGATLLSVAPTESDAAMPDNYSTSATPPAPAGGVRGGGATAGSSGGGLTKPARGRNAPKRQVPRGPLTSPQVTPPPDASAGQVRTLQEIEDLRRDEDGSADFAFHNADPGNEDYARILDNPFLDPSASLETRLSTFSIDVDTASYSNMRRFINGGQIPPIDAVRIEEMINYFSFDYDPPSTDDEHPFNVHVDVTAAPWTPDHRLVRIGIQGEEIPFNERPATNLVFLLDVSGSMGQANKLPLVKKAIGLLVDQLDGDDKISIVVYAGASGLVLEPTFCSDKTAIRNSFNRLQAGGSTNGGSGIELAYNVAQQEFIEGGVNRVILCTDGDFNVGTSSDDQLVKLIEDKRKSGVFLSVMGFGTGNFKDSKMEKLSNAGNGNFAYIDNEAEANKVFVEQIGGTLMTIAKDVKVQVDFNPAQVQAYRLIGYENRMLRARDFTDDTKDAGEIGAGHNVTALYEVVPHGVEINLPTIEASEFSIPGDDVETDATVENDERMLAVRLRYKQPDGDTSTEFRVNCIDDGASLTDASPDMQFAAAVAGFGMVLRNSEHKGQASIPYMIELAEGAVHGSGISAGLLTREQALTLLQDFAQYTTIAQEELASANLRALLGSGYNDAQTSGLLAKMTDEERAAFDRALATAMTIGSLEVDAKELQRRLIDGAKEAPRATRQTADLSYRLEFIELLYKAAQIR